MEKNRIVIRDPKTFCFNFDFPKDVDVNLKHKIEFLIKSNEKNLQLKNGEKNGGKNGVNVPSLEVVEVVLVQCNLVGNQYQQKSEVLYTFTANTSYSYL